MQTWCLHWCLLKDIVCFAPLYPNIFEWIKFDLLFIASISLVYKEGRLTLCHFMGLAHIGLLCQVPLSCLHVSQDAHSYTCACCVGGIAKWSWANTQLLSLPNASDVAGGKQALWWLFLMEFSPPNEGQQWVLTSVLCSQQWSSPGVG